MGRGRVASAQNSLLYYRGGDTDTVEKELQRCMESREAAGRGRDWRQSLARTLSPQFLKPFLLLNLILNIGLEWAGFPVLAFYMHSVLARLQVPWDRYWVAVCLAGYRSCLTICLSFILYRLPRRPVYLGSGLLVSMKNKAVVTTVF